MFEMLKEKSTEKKNEEPEYSSTSSVLVSYEIIQYWETCHLKSFVVDEQQMIEVSFLVL